MSAPGEKVTTAPAAAAHLQEEMPLYGFGLCQAPEDVAAAAEEAPERTADGRTHRDDAKQPPKKASWPQMATVMIADVVGVGVLSLASAVAKVGWVLGILMLVGFFPLNAYTGILLSRTRILVADFGPKSVTMGDMAWYTIGKWFMYFVAGYVYVNVFFMLGDYILVTGQSLGMIFYDVHICKPAWSAIGAIIIWAIMQFSRTLHHASYLCWFNMACITTSVFIACIYLFIQGQYVSLAGSYTQVINPDLTVQTFFGALSSFLFAYSGQFMYLELMAEMTTPTDFPKTFLIAGPYQVFMYVFTASVGYAYKGVAVSGFIINSIPYGAAYRASAVFLFFHMLVTYVIKGQLLSRAIHVGLHPYSANDFTGVRGKLLWAAITFSVIALDWICATAIPFFDYFTALLGSLLSLPCLVFPAIFFMAAHKTAGLRISIIEYIVMAVFCFALGFVLIVFGLWDSIDGIITSYSTLGGPFSCQCQDIWSYGCPS